MFTKFLYILFTALMLTPGLSIKINAQVSNEDFNELKRKVELLESENSSMRNELNNQDNQLKNKIDSYAPLGLVLFLFGGFCALWAQNTGRNAWTWFFLGCIFSMLTVITVLINNSKEQNN